jgi:hypothetical protein
MQSDKRVEDAVAFARRRTMAPVGRMMGPKPNFIVGKTISPHTFVVAFVEKPAATHFNQ